MNYNRPTVSEVKQSAIKSVKWAVSGQVVSRSIQPIITLILARVLVPEDFGVVGVALIAIGLANILQDFGLGKTLIQRESDVEGSANVIFWTNMGLSGFLYLVLFVTAPLISEFFHEPKVATVLRVLCLQIVLCSLVSVHQALFQRQFQFKKLFFVGLLSSAVPGFVSVPLALLGYGVWALVFGSLAGAVAQVFLFWRVSPWRPQLRYDFQLARELFGFSSWVTLEAFLGWLIMYGDSIAIGYILSTHELGSYRVGMTLVNVAYGATIYNLFPVIYSSFCRLNSQTELKSNYLRMNKIFVFASIFVGIILFSLSNLFTRFIGRQWLGLNIVIIALVAREIFTSLTMGIGPEIYRAIGKPHIHPKIMFLSSIIYIPTYFGAAQYGLTVFVCVRALLSIIVGNGIHFYYLRKIIGISGKDVMKVAVIPFVNLFACAILFLIFKATIINATNSLELAFCLVLVALFIGLTAIFDKKFLIGTLRLMKSVMIST